MNWKNLVSEDQLSEIDRHSKDQPILIFKHSTSCSISSIAKLRLEDNGSFDEGTIQLYYLDLIANRSLSNAIAEKFNVAHESPQVLLIKNEQCIYESSHLDIHADEIKDALTHKVF